MQRVVVDPYYQGGTVVGKPADRGAILLARFWSAGKENNAGRIIII